MSIAWNVFWSCVKKSWFGLSLTVLLTIPILSAAPLSLFLLQSMMLNAVPDDLRTFSFMIIAYTLLRIVGQSGAIGVKRMLQWNALQLSNQMKENILTHLFSIKLSSLKKMESGKWLSGFAICLRFTSSVSDVLYGLLHMIIYLLIAFLFLLSIDWILVVLISIPILFNFLISRILAARLYKSYTDRQNMRKNVWGHVAEVINGIKDIRINGYQNNIADQHLAMMCHSEVVRLRTAKLENLQQTLNNMLLQIGLVVLLLAAYWLFQQTIGDLLIVFFAVQFVYGVIAGFNSIHISLQSSKVSLREINEILSIPTEKEGGRPFDPQCREVFRFEQVSLRRGHNFLYKNTNLQVNQGDFVVIYGSSGTGKTTLVDMLLGIEKPTGGSVYAFGVDIEKIDRRMLYQHIALCPQFPVLLKGSVLTNIAWDNEGTTDIDAIMESLCLNIEKSQPIETQGVGVSGGQALRIGIARALYSDRNVLIFDEPSSSLDRATEDIVYKLFRALKGKKTIILITHHNIFRSLADKLITIGDGHIVISERGGHQ